MFVTVLQRLLQIFFLSGDTHVHFVGTCALRSLATVLKALVTPGLFRRLSSTLPMLPLLLFSVICPEEFSSYIFVLFFIYMRVFRAALVDKLLFFWVFFSSSVVLKLILDQAVDPVSSLVPVQAAQAPALDPASN